MNYLLKKNEINLDKKEFNYYAPLSEKELELKRIESLQPKKFNKYYLERFCTILSQSNLKRNQKYFIQRKNLKNNSKHLKEEQEKLYITSENFEEKNNDNEVSNNEDIYPDYFLSEENKNFLINKNEDEEKEKILYDKLKTKTNLNKRSYDNIHNKRIFKPKNILSPNFIRNFDPNLAKAIEKNKMDKLTDKQAKNLYYISDLNIFNKIEKINEKKEKLKKMKNQNNKYLNNISLFKYDSKKWNEKREELNKNINEIMFNKFNKENHHYLNNMKKGINKTHENARNIENNLNIFFGEIDDFIEKQAEYIKENNPQKENDSREYSKKNSLQKRIKSKKETEEN